MNFKRCIGFFTCPPNLWITLWKMDWITRQCPCAVRLYGFGTNNQQYYLLMESCGYETTSFVDQLALGATSVKPSYVHK